MFGLWNRITGAKFMTDKTFAEEIEDLHKEIYNIFLEVYKSLKIDKLLNWIYSKIMRSNNE